ncbi:MAG: hypothetical protein ACRDSS_03620 [Actinocrinis sp.]
MTELMITRAELVRAARLSIEDARKDGTVPTALVRQAMRVARTAERVTGGWRAADRSCGCLIGSLHLDDPDWYPDLESQAAHYVAADFQRWLAICLGGHTFRRPVRVVDG